MDAEKRIQAAQDAQGEKNAAEHDPGQKSAHCAPSEAEGYNPDLFTDPPKPKTCQFCGKTLVKPPKNKTYCDNICRAHASRARKKHEKIERLDEYQKQALSFAEKNPDIVYRISDWIKINMKRGRSASFRYYWERYRLYRQAINDPVYLNNNFEKTIKQLIVNRFPELSSIVKMKNNT